MYFGTLLLWLAMFCTVLTLIFNARLDTITSSDIAHASADDLFELDALLDMREPVAQAPAWPVDLAGVKRIFLHIVLPPLTWAAAALVERYMDLLV